ncbi:MAG TPA: hypothetical protein VJ835_04135 [Fimbriimonadaceae bacterium]|nr:hypothetical protein [Fimbriimonadaceae bacterium]
MKRSLLTLVFVAAVGAAFAQAPFTIVRPADGSKVREKVSVLIPKNSIPQGGYVGVFLNGKFVEAVVPPLQGKYYNYVLDTKGRGIADGKVNLEMVLYVDYNENPRIVDRSSVTVNVANSASIAIPANGFRLRYKFAPKTQLVYGLQVRAAFSTISGTQNRAGGRPAELPLEAEKIRLLYAVDNSYGNGDGLVRIQALTTPGKDWVVLTSGNTGEPTKYFDYMMHPIYMRISNTGREIFGSVPNYFAMEGTSGSTGEDVNLNLYALYPLPTLPEKAVRPGDSWQSRFQNGILDLDRKDEVTRLTSKFPARGEFVGVEWEMGHPCAKIKNTITQSTKSIEGDQLKARGSSFADDKIELTETIWFALDKGIVMKSVRDMTIDRKMESQGAGGGGNAGPSAAGGGARPGAGSGGGKTGGGVGLPGQANVRQGKTGGGIEGGDVGGGFGQGQGRSGGFGQGQGRSGGAAPQVQYLRIRQQYIFILEQ